MAIQVEEKLMIKFDKQKKSLVFYEFYDDGTEYLYTEVELSRIEKSGKEHACQEIGKIVLLGFDSIRERLFSL